MATPTIDQYEYQGTFEELCLKLGDKFVAGGNQPFLLNDPEHFWLVQSGNVEVFAVNMRDGQAVDSRYHVSSVLPGQVLFGLSLDEYDMGLGLMAVALVNSTFLKVPTYHLRQMTQQPGLAPIIAGLLDDWLAGLAADLTKEVVPVRADILLEAGGDFVIEPLQKIGPRKGGLWLRSEEGEFLFLGEEELDPSFHQNPLPLYPGTWLQATAKSELTSLDTVSLIADASLWEGLKLYYELYFRVKFTNIKAVDYDEINRLRKKAEYDLEVSREALVKLSSIVMGKESKEPEKPKSGKNLLLVACQLIGKAQGIAIQSPAEQEGETRPTNPLNDIASASHLRLRQITLEDNWWTKDSGPFLAFLKANDGPVAVLPTSTHSYEYINPANGEHIIVTKETATSLTQAGFVFYRSFPAQTLRFWDLIRFGSRGSKQDLLITLLLCVGIALLALFIPNVTGYLFDTVIPSGQASLLVQVLVGLLVVAFTAAAFQISRSIAILRLETRVDSAAQAALWDKLLDLPTAFFRKYSVGDLAVRAMGIDTIRQRVGGNILTALLSSVFSLFSFFQLFAYDIGLALVALVLVIITLVIIGSLNLWQLRYQRQLNAMQGQVAGLVLQLLNGIAKLRVAGAEVRGFGVWAREFAEQRKVAYKARTIGNILTAFNSIWVVVTSIIIFAAVSAFKNQNLSTGTFLAFMAAFGQFLAAVIIMNSALTSVLQAITVFERLKIILETPTEAKSGKIDPGELSGALEFNHVSFRYSPETPYILNDVSLQVKPGQFVAIVGPSGSGKSTLLRLLLGFETPEVGSIYYDNQDLAELDIQVVRRQIGTVIQNGKLMAGEIISNIIGSAPFTLQDAWAAARMAGFEKDIKEMPMGMFTLVSEGGSTLSGGQKQRLMIARAIVAKPRLLFFDEATSALDNQTQAIVSQSLENLQATRIVIAHRLSTIINADVIYVMQGGKVVQSGAYAELMQQEGPFRELASRQLA